MELDVARKEQEAGRAVVGRKRTEYDELVDGLDLPDREQMAAEQNHLRAFNDNDLNRWLDGSGDDGFVDRLPNKARSAVVATPNYIKDVVEL